MDEATSLAGVSAVTSSSLHVAEHRSKRHCLCPTNRARVSEAPALTSRMRDGRTICPRASMSCLSVDGSEISFRYPYDSGVTGKDRQIFARGAPCRSEERRVGKECRSRWSPYH